MIGIVVVNEQSLELGKEIAMLLDGYLDNHFDKKLGERLRGWVLAGHSYIIVDVDRPKQHLTIWKEGEKHEFAF